MANDYPNGWKDGWSSADHAEQSYSPYAWERAEREARNNPSARTEHQYTPYQGMYSPEYYENIDKARERAEQEQRAHVEFEATNIVMQQKRDAYNQKSFFQRAWAHMRGKSFYQNQGEIREQVADHMAGYSTEYLNNFVDSGGKSR